MTWWGRPDTIHLPCSIVWREREWERVKTMSRRTFVFFGWAVLTIFSRKVSKGSMGGFGNISFFRVLRPFENPRQLFPTARRATFRNHIYVLFFLASPGVVGVCLVIKGLRASDVYRQRLSRCLWLWRSRVCMCGWLISPLSPIGYCGTWTCGGVVKLNISLVL